MGPDDLWECLEMFEIRADTNIPPKALLSHLQKAFHSHCALQEGTASSGGLADLRGNQNEPSTSEVQGSKAGLTCSSQCWLLPPPPLRWKLKKKLTSIFIQSKGASVGFWVETNGLRVVGSPLWPREGVFTLRVKPRHCWVRGPDSLGC